MAIGDLYIEGVAIAKAKADTPLIIDPNRMLSRAVVFQGLQPVRRVSRGLAAGSRTGPGCSRRTACGDAPRPGHEEIALDKYRWPHRRDLPVVPMCRRQFACDVGQITSTFPRVPCLSRGAFRDRHERRVRDAMDATPSTDE
jgi:hypothetical protein